MMKGAKVKEVDKGQIYKNLVKTIFTQVSAKEGIKRWGEDAIAAIMKELKQLQEGSM